MRKILSKKETFAEMVSVVDLFMVISCAPKLPAPWMQAAQQVALHSNISWLRRRTAGPKHPVTGVDLTPMPDDDLVKIWDIINEYVIPHSHLADATPCIPTPLERTLRAVWRGVVETGEYPAVLAGMPDNDN